MTVEYPFSLAQLAQILSALENERRNPNTKRNAIKAIERNAAQIGLTTEDIFDAADGLLSGRLTAAEFRAQVRDEGYWSASFVTEAPAEPAPDDATDEPSEAYITPNAGPLAVARSSTGDDGATDVAEAAEDAPVVATAAVAANLSTTETQLAVAGRMPGRQALAASRARQAGRNPARRDPARPARRHRAGRRPAYAARAAPATSIQARSARGH